MISKHQRTIFFCVAAIFPTQLMGCTLDFFLLDLILRLEKTHRFDNGRYVIFMGFYIVNRFIIKFFRDTPKTKWLLSNGQWFFIICIVILLFYLILKRRDKK